MDKKIDKSRPFTLLLVGMLVVGGIPAALTAPAAASTPEISNFTTSVTDSGNITVSFDSNESLSNIEVMISDAETSIASPLIDSDFTETGTGPYTYTATYDASSSSSPGGDGEYRVLINKAEDSSGNNGAPSETKMVLVGMPSVDVGVSDDTPMTGETVSIDWTATSKIDSPISDTVLSYSTDGSTWTEIAAVNATGSYDWTVPESIDGGQIRAVSYDSDNTRNSDIIDFSTVSDSDGDGIADPEDPYPDNAEETTNPSLTNISDGEQVFVSLNDSTGLGYSEIAVETLSNGTWTVVDRAYLLPGESLSTDISDMASEIEDVRVSEHGPGQVETVDLLDSTTGGGGGGSTDSGAFGSIGTLPLVGGVVVVIGIILMSRD